MQDFEKLSTGKKVGYVAVGLTGLACYGIGKALCEGGKLAIRGAAQVYDTVSEDLRLKSEIEESNAFCEEVKNKFEQKKILCEHEFEEVHKEYLKIVADVEKDFAKFESLEKNYLERKFSTGNISWGSSNNLPVANVAIKSGISAGIGVSAGTVGLMTAFGSAGTGAALSSLTGVAYIKATLAALGGGTLVSGGLGMIGGALVLGATFFAPLIIVTAYVAHEKIKSVHKEAQKNKETMKQLQAESKIFFDKAFKGIEDFREMNHEFRNVAAFFRRLVKLTPALLITLSGEKYHNLLTDTANILQGYGKLNPLDDNSENQRKALQNDFEACLERYNELSIGIPLENQELQELFDRALTTAQKELDIMAWRLGYGIVNKKFILQLQKLLEKKVTVKILYGIGETDDPRNSDTNEIVTSLKARFEKFPNFKTKRINTHGKIFICDEDFCVISSFNALTNSNFKKNISDAWEETGMLFFNKNLIAGRRERYFNF